MIKIRNAGIREAIEELRTMSLSKTLRFLHEERLKAKRDPRTSMCEMRAKLRTSCSC